MLFATFASKLTIMQIVRRDFHEKQNTKLSSFVRNTSCSRGWLRLLVQITFGVITVVSFVLIVHMAWRSPNNSPTSDDRCSVNGCRIVCNEAPFYENHESDIINSVMEAEVHCKKVFLTLKNPIFVNSSIPLNWLSNMRSNIHFLSIIGGNIRHIPPQAFMSPFANFVKSILLEDITLDTWIPETFIGLSNLEELFIKNTKLENIHKNALMTIDDTLKTLVIKATNTWNPANLTGSSNPIKLTTVDFSRNIFLDILNDKSFYTLQKCKILHLSSCHITALGKGTLDPLEKIEILFLNNNYIHQVPDGLFNALIALPHNPRINLQDNPWICDCSVNDLINLHRYDLLIVEPSCYYPIEFRGLKFSEFVNYCTDNNSNTETIDSQKGSYISVEENSYNGTLNIRTKMTCKTGSKIDDDANFLLISPFKNYQCVDNRIRNYELISLASNANIFLTNSNWIKPIFYLQSQPYSIVEIGSFGPYNYGLLWFRSQCPDEIYCVSNVPRVLRIYETNVNTHYTFCPFHNGTILHKECVAYDLSKDEIPSRKSYTYLLYILIAFLCLSCGALSVYGLIRKNPSLLKGSKRVLFVKHKQVDALVLPPKIPLRHDLIKNDRDTFNNNRNIFIVSPNVNNLPWKFTRMNSTRSTHSVPSYISAIQPSEDQLAQWRKHNFNKNSSLRSTDSSISAFSWIYDGDSIPYLQIDSKEPIYEYIN